MGLITWIIIAIVVLAIIGLGVGTFFSGVWKGAQELGDNPVVQNTTGEVKQSISNATENAEDELIP